MADIVLCQQSQSVCIKFDVNDASTTAQGDQSNERTDWGTPATIAPNFPNG